MDFDSIVLAIIAGLSVFGLVRVLDGPTVWDRMLGFALFSSKLGFIGTIMIARFVERKGDV